MAWTKWHRLDRQGVRRRQAGNLWDEVWRICIENECTCFCKPNEGWSKTEKTFHCLLIYKNWTYLWKKMDWYWPRNSIQSCVPSGRKIEYSSSSWSITSRRRWCDWILEIKRLSSERFWELSALVWWNVDEQNGKRRRQNTGLMMYGRTRWQEAEATIKFPILYWLVRTRNSVSPSSSRCHSGRNPIDPSLHTVC